MSSYYQSFDGVKISYEEKGNGKPIIFLPGWSMGKAYFRKQIDGLSDRYKIITLDLRGMGDSEKVTEKPDIEIWAKDLREFLKNKNFSHFILAGWSMGAFAMWKYFDLFGKNGLDGMIVLEMVGNLGEPGWAADENTSMEQDYKKYVAGFVEGMFRVSPPPNELSLLIAESQKTPLKTAQYLNLVLENADLRSIFPKIDVPTLIIYGKYLLFFTQEQEQETIKGIKNAKTVIFENSKHCPFWEEPAECNELIAKFVENIS